MGTQIDMSGGGDVDEELEAAADRWLDLHAEKKALSERIDEAAEELLAKMRERDRRIYELSDGTIVSIESSSKVKGKRPKRRRVPVEDDASGGKVTVMRGGKPKGVN